MEKQDAVDFVMTRRGMFFFDFFLSKCKDQSLGKKYGMLRKDVRRIRRIGRELLRDAVREEEKNASYVAA